MSWVKENEKEHLVCWEMWFAPLFHLSFTTQWICICFDAPLKGKFIPRFSHPNPCIRWLSLPSPSWATLCALTVQSTPLPCNAIASYIYRVCFFRDFSREFCRHELVVFTSHRIEDEENLNKKAELHTTFLVFFPPIRNGSSRSCSSSPVTLDPKNLLLWVYDQVFPFFRFSLGCSKDWRFLQT